MLKQHFPFISHLQPHRDASQGHPASIHETSGPRVRSNLRQGHQEWMSHVWVNGLWFGDAVPKWPASRTFEEDLWERCLLGSMYVTAFWPGNLGLCARVSLQEWTQQLPLAELLLFESATLDVGKRKQKDFCQRTNWNLQNGQEEKGKFQRKPYFSDGWKGLERSGAGDFTFFLQGAIC